MNFSVENARAQKVWFDEHNLWLLLIDGRQLSVPKAYFPLLQEAQPTALEKYSLSGGGAGIHWDMIDEDLFVPNLLLGIYSRKKPPASA
ncbi:MAG: DUF2442 domain-containing protein [Treponema sp.]|nr:DUF2442 domain-containing protein [Treponema sp.]